MTVKCLSPQDKQTIARQYISGSFITDLAYYHHVSPRTISRVLAEANLLTPTERVDAETKKIKRIMQKYGLTVDTLDATLSILKRTKNAN